MYVTHKNLGYYGFIGNTLWQTAAIFGIAKKNNMIPSILKQNTIEYLPINCIGNKQASKDHVQKFQLFNYFNLSQLFVVQNIYDWKLIVQDQQGSYIQKTEKLTQNTMLVGYLGNLKYFDLYRTYIKQQLTFKQNILIQCKNILDKLSDGKQTIAIHIRDYDNVEGLYYDCNLQYYKKALQVFEDLTKYNVILFSLNNPQKGRSILKQLNIQFKTHIWRNKKIWYQDGYYDLCLMSLCDNIIAANSTFSWWASYLNSKNKIIMPKKFFAGQYEYKNNNIKINETILQQWLLV